MSERYTCYHGGTAVIRDKELLPEAMRKLSAYEDLEERTAGLSDTVWPMISSDYKERFEAEYRQTKIRYERLKDFCNKIELSEERPENELEFLGMQGLTHDTPYTMLREQQRIMGEYLHILELRAIIEEVDIN